MGRASPKDPLLPSPFFRPNALMFWRQTLCAAAMHSRHRSLGE
jgi:hypothetical protein